MEPTIAIQVADFETFEKAYYLLECFFLEEGFSTPTQEMRSSLQAMINAPNSEVFLALQDEEAVGIATVTSSIGIEYGRSAELEDLYVLPEERGRGVASALIEAVCTWCLERDISVLLVTVIPEGETKYKLTEYYQRHGFSNTMRVILQREISNHQ